MEEKMINETMENQEVQETKKDNKLKDFGAKVGGLIKKHGKKVAAAAAVGAVALVSYGFGVKRGEEEMMDPDEETTVEDNSDEI